MGKPFFLHGQNFFGAVSTDDLTLFHSVLTLSYLTTVLPIRDNPPALQKGDRAMGIINAANPCSELDQPLASHWPAGSLLVITDDPGLIRGLRSICDWLDMRLEPVSSGINAGIILHQRRPTAVIIEADGAEQDGFHIMKQIANHDRTLPIMVLTYGDPALAGAVEAIQDLWGLTGVTQPTGELTVSELMEFLAKATRGAGLWGLMPF
jgi:hypothetical protein